MGMAQVALPVSSASWRVGGGPYTVPITVSNVSRLSTVSLTVAYDPARVRVRNVTEGSFMRSGGASAVFTQQVAPGRVDVTATRSTDATGATGGGAIGAVLFEPVAAGPVTLDVSGTATGPGGTPMGLQFVSTKVAVEP